MAKPARTVETHNAIVEKITSYGGINLEDTVGEESVMQFVNQLATRLSKWGEWIGVGGVLIMVVVTCADVLGAKLFTTPVPGSTESSALSRWRSLFLQWPPPSGIRGISVLKCLLQK